MRVSDDFSSSVADLKIDLDKFSSVFNLDEDIISKIIHCYVSGISEKYIIPVSRNYIDMLSQITPSQSELLSRYLTPSGSFNLQVDCLERILKAVTLGADISGMVFNMMPYDKTDLLCRFLEHGCSFNGMALQSTDMLQALYSAYSLGYDVEFILTQGYSASQIMYLLGSSLSSDCTFISVPSSIPVSVMPLAVSCIHKGIDIGDIIDSNKLLSYSDEVLTELFVSKLLGKFDKMMLLPNLSLDQLIRFRSIG